MSKRTVFASVAPIVLVEPDPNRRWFQIKNRSTAFLYLSWDENPQANEFDADLILIPGAAFDAYEAVASQRMVGVWAAATGEAVIKELGDPAQQEISGHFESIPISGASDYYVAPPWEQQ